MTGKRNFEGLLKIAGLQPVQTVGDFMHAWNANLNANKDVRRFAFNRINNAGIDVKQPASRLPYILGGGIIGRQAASYLGASPFWKNVATVGGAMVGNKVYNNKNPDPFNRKIAPGVMYRGY